VFFDERDGDIEGQARDRDARLSGKIPLSLARARRLSAHRGGRSAHRASLCVFVEDIIRK
jgi:hypothetical protein